MAETSESDKSLERLVIFRGREVAAVRNGWNLVARAEGVDGEMRARAEG